MDEAVVVKYDAHGLFEISGLETLRHVAGGGISSVNVECNGPGDAVVTANVTCLYPSNQGCAVAANAECSPNPTNYSCGAAVVNGICGANGQCGGVNLNC